MHFQFFKVFIKYTVQESPQIYGITIKPTVGFIKPFNKLLPVVTRDKNINYIVLAILELCMYLISSFIVPRRYRFIQLLMQKRMFSLVSNLFLEMKEEKDTKACFSPGRCSRQRSKLLLISLQQATKARYSSRTTTNFFGMVHVRQLQSLHNKNQI